jgi:hypothetical protein
MQDSDDREKALAASPLSGKKPYSAPQLVDYGSVTKLTRGGSSSTGEGFGDMKMAPCL